MDPFGHPDLQRLGRSMRNQLDETLDAGAVERVETTFEAVESELGEGLEETQEAEAEAVSEVGTNTESQFESGTGPGSDSETESSSAAVEMGSSIP